MESEPEKRRVFLSSTKVDLGPERTVAWLSLRLLGFDVVRMEDFQSGTHDGRTECVKALDSCAAYVLLIGHEYGSALANTGLSYTHAEYERARALSMPIFPFVKHGIAEELRHSTHPLRLQDFYDIVTEAHVVRHPLFRDTDELAESIESAFQLWERRGEVSRPTFARRPAPVAEPISYALAQVRRKLLQEGGFSVVLVDGLTALAKDVPEASPSRLLRKALELRAELNRFGATTMMINELAAYGKSPAEVFIRRVELAGSRSSVIVCLIHGRTDYPIVSAFVDCGAQVAAMIPPARLRALTDRDRVADIYLDYAEIDVESCALSIEISRYLRQVVDERLLTSFA